MDEQDTQSPVFCGQWLWSLLRPFTLLWTPGSLLGVRAGSWSRGSVVGSASVQTPLHQRGPSAAGSTHTAVLFVQHR